MSLHLAVTGRHGQVARSLIARAAQEDVVIVPLARPDFDLSRPKSFMDAVRAARPDAIVSAAAYTAVDRAESEPELAEAVNGRAPGELGRVAAALNVPILHLSTDYVFSGDKPEPYVETDATGPINVYGHSKLHGERALAAASDNHVILRTSWVFSPEGRNFVNAMLALAQTRDALDVVADQRGCPTSADEIARALIAVARRVIADPAPELRGVFHMAGGAETNWAAFAEAVFDGARRRGWPAAAVRPTRSSAWPSPARRPMNSRLDSARLRSNFGVSLDPWPVSLDKHLNRLVELRQRT